MELTSESGSAVLDLLLYPLGPASVSDFASSSELDILRFPPASLGLRLGPTGLLRPA